MRCFFATAIIYLLTFPFTQIATACAGIVQAILGLCKHESRTKPIIILVGATLHIVCAILCCCRLFQGMASV